jgi:methionyl aminopeptidase
MSWERQVSIKSKDEIAIMREAGIINAEALKAASEVCVPGATTWDVNAAADRVLDHYKVTSPFKGVPGPIPFPASTCVSVNDVLVHGIPSKKIFCMREILFPWIAGQPTKVLWLIRLLRSVSEKSRKRAQKLMEVTENSLYIGIEKMYRKLHGRCFRSDSGIC